MTDPNKNLTLGTRLYLTQENGGLAPTHVWMTLVEKASWDDADWWRAETDKGEYVWLIDGGEVLRTAHRDDGA
jgi:hypothetical protein